MSCPTSSLCVTVGGQDVAFSDDPSAGGGSWTVVTGVDQSTAPECGKYGGDSGCYTPSLLSVSCPTRSLCEALDSSGGGVRSTDPGSVQGWPRSGEAAEGDYDGPVECPSDGLCLSQCAVGVGFAGAECPGNTYDAGDILVSDPTGSRSSGSETIAQSPLLGLWCASAARCFAADSTGDLLASTAPSNTSRPWLTVFATEPPTALHPDPEVALACPSASLCLALDQNGNLLAGGPPPTGSQLRASLIAALRMPPRRLSIRRLLRDRGYWETFRALAPGRLTITWYHPGSRTGLAMKTAVFGAPATRKIKVIFTPSGRRFLATATAHPRVIAKATFTPPDGTTIGLSRSFSLRGS